LYRDDDDDGSDDDDDDDDEDYEDGPRDYHMHVAVDSQSWTI